MTVSTPTSKLDEDWKLEFENGTTIKGVGSPPTVWHLVEPSEVIDNTKEGSKEPVAMVGVPLNNAPQDKAKEGKNTRSLITNKEAKEDTMKKVSSISSPSIQDLFLFSIKVWLGLISGHVSQILFAGTFAILPL